MQYNGTLANSSIDQFLSMPVGIGMNFLSGCRSAVVPGTFSLMPRWRSLPPPPSRPMTVTTSNPALPCSIRDRDEFVVIDSPGPDPPTELANASGSLVVVQACPDSSPQRVIPTATHPAVGRVRPLAADEGLNDELAATIQAPPHQAAAPDSLVNRKAPGRSRWLRRPGSFPIL